MQITVNIKNETVQSYLNNYNEVNSTNLTVDTLTPAQHEKVAKAFARAAVSEIEMRCDDHDGFETHRMFGQLSVIVTAGEHLRGGV